MTSSESLNPGIKTILYSAFARKLVVVLHDGSKLIVHEPEVMVQSGADREPDFDHESGQFIHIPDMTEALVEMADPKSRTRFSGEVKWTRADSFQIIRAHETLANDKKRWWEWDFASDSHDDVKPALYREVSFTQTAMWGRYYGTAEQRDEFLADVMALCEKWSQR